MTIKNKTITGQYEVVEDITCNICKQSCNKFTATHDNGQPQNNYEFAEIEAAWGYFSNKDLTVHKAHICEDCFDKYLASLIEFDTEDQLLC